MFNKSLLTISTALVLPLLLASCGGSSSDNSSGSNVSKNTTDPSTSISTKENTTEEKGISERLLANDTPLPSLPENNNPLPILKDEATIEALKNGIYEYGISYIYGFGNADEIDCKLGSEVLCPTITEYRFDTNKNEVISKQWAYMPVHKKWLELEEKDNFVRLPDFSLSATDLVTDSSIDEINFLTHPAELSKNYLSYKFGNSTFEISGSETSLANQSYTSSLSGDLASYSTNAKQYQFYTSLSAGEIFIQEEMGGLGTYSSAVDFRDSHINKSNPTCLLGEFIVFSPKTLGATSYINEDSNGIECDTSAIESPLKQSKAYKEGIKTIGDSKVIYFSNEGYDSSNTSSLQFLPAFYINSNGHVSEGKALQKDYAFIDNTFYVNKTAVKDWMKTKYNDPEALNLPNL